jgi:ribosomal protein S18 acetylase RimI-like enzyme
MTIRRATPQDFLAIAALDREAWRENRNPEFIPDGEHVWRVWVEHAVVYCALDGPELIGAVLAFPCLDGAYWLHKVFVAKTHRGRGTASRLFEALLTELDRMGVDVFLTVDPANAAALRLYGRWGFTERTLIRGYYRKSEDRFVLGRRAQQQDRA